MIAKHTYLSICVSILGMSILFWIVLLFNPGNILTVQHCVVSSSGASNASFQMLIEMNPISSLLAGWTLMVFAMMLPKLIIPICYIYDRSLRRLAFRSVLLFILGYSAVWISVGLLMIPVILLGNLVWPNSYIPAMILAAIGTVWQFSPAKQRFLNLGHQHPPLSAFGWEAGRDALLFGIHHGKYCVGAGWALMLFPMLLPKGHDIAMLVVTGIMVSEHMEHPRFPRWRVFVSSKLARIMFAQTQLKLKRLLN